MPTSLFQYEMLPTTWFYISGLMIIAVFFRFNRFWSVRNFDIIGLILTTPGLLYIAMGKTANDPIIGTGYLWLTFLGGLIFIRMILDTIMIRRPLLEPNLSSSGLTFACILLMAFMIASIMVNRGDKIESLGTLRLEQIMTMRQEFGSVPTPHFDEKPGYTPFHWFVDMTNSYFAPSEKYWKANFTNSDVVSFDSTGKMEPQTIEGTSPVKNRVEKNKRTFVQDIQKKVNTAEGKGDVLESAFLVFCIIFIQCGIVLSMIYIGQCHFGNIKTGVAAAFIYLLHPYVVQEPSNLAHILPAFLIVTAIAFYRRPVLSGILIGLAGSLVFYPFFLIPLWIGFYWKKGFVRFVLGAFSAVLGMALLLLLSPPSFGSYGVQAAMMFGYRSVCVLFPDGLWAYCPSIYRIPIFAVFAGLCIGLMLWPPRKNLATLMACSTLLMIGVQFWMGNQGGLFIAWYLPLLILTIFRPNLEDRVAVSTVVDI